MQLPFDIIVDTSCFILLNKIDELELLHQLFHEVFTTDDIAEEFGQELPEWIHTRPEKIKVSESIGVRNR